ncbi:carboxypeptidase-like regulatory domain-containing protein [Chitinophaga sp. HK235]|uniref:carboxypeptidase-like regulatory domain-containing protein n=1 Tax=Chitinophaga sp. HK235 TaxID=2952571 RepID=UPI00201363F7|nr:carboxypeptidase-like regulatory domain-containing protein [Chitinophaga sp. HK235]
MKKTITGMFALAAMVVGMSSFRSADATTVRSLESASIKIDSLSAADSLARFDSLSLVGLDSAARIDSFTSVDSISRFAGLDSVKGMDSLRAVEGGSITGKVTPAEGATAVEADNGSEKLKGTVSSGSFAIPAAKAGTYTITIHGKAPFKNAVIKDVKVEDGKATDLGEIKLEQ